jgi:thiol-disulfide isomerase/thioredoxin
VELTALDGTATVRADDITGPAVINLWATWCGPCRAELPAFEAVHLQLADRVRFVGVNQGDEGGPAASFLDEVGVSFEQYLDLGLRKKPHCRTLQSQGFPVWPSVFP